MRFALVVSPLIIGDTTNSGHPNNSGLRVAFVAGKKVGKRAVDRNLIKRRLREIYKIHRAILPDNIWMMVIALPEALNASFQELDDDFEKLCRKVATQKWCNFSDKNL